MDREQWKEIEAVVRAVIHEWDRRRPWAKCEINVS